MVKTLKQALNKIKKPIEIKNILELDNDCIDRTEVKEMLENIPAEDDEKFLDWFQKIHSKLPDLPRVQRWISDNNLPEEYKPVLVYYKYYYRGIYAFKPVLGLGYYTESYGRNEYVNNLELKILMWIALFESDLESEV